jgi:hypothetical protein
VYRALFLMAATALAGCGLNVTSPDLFVLKRTGQGKPLTLLVNDDGTIRCNGGTPKMLANDLLLRARDLATSLDTDAKHGMKLPNAANSISAYSVTLQDGTITFPDTAGASHKELAQAELFTVQAAQSACGI